MEISGTKRVGAIMGVNIGLLCSPIHLLFVGDVVFFLNRNISEPRKLKEILGGKAIGMEIKF
jgi:hypothetical protein